MKILDSILSRFKTRFGQAMLAVVISTLLLRFPGLTAWCDEALQKWIMTTADAVRTLALPIILMFAKSFTETGGSKPLTPEAASRAETINPPSQ